MEYPVVAHVELPTHVDQLVHTVDTTQSALMTGTQLPDGDELYDAVYDRVTVWEGEEAGEEEGEEEGERDWVGA